MRGRLKKPSIGDVAESCNRFYSKVELSGDCHIWTGTSQSGYGLFKVGRVNLRAAEVSYVLDRGCYPNEFMKLVSLCGNPLCVNPRHVYAKVQLVYGKGLNDLRRVRSCKVYSLWSDMLARCYSSKRLSKFPTYRDCSVSGEWRLFSIFKSWAEPKMGQGLHLDKDLKVLGNRVYGEEFCSFISPRLNMLIRDGLTSKLKPHQKECGKYFSHCCGEYLGLYNTESGAILAHDARKLEIVKDLVSKETCIETLNQLKSTLVYFNKQLLKEKANAEG